MASADLACGRRQRAACRCGSLSRCPCRPRVPPRCAGASSAGPGRSRRACSRRRSCAARAWRRLRRDVYADAAAARGPPRCTTRAVRLVAPPERGVQRAARRSSCGAAASSPTADDPVEVVVPAGHAVAARPGRRASARPGWTATCVTTAPACRRTDRVRTAVDLIRRGRAGRRRRPARPPRARGDRRGWIDVRDAVATLPRCRGEQARPGGRGARRRARGVAAGDAAAAAHAPRGAAGTRRPAPGLRRGRVHRAGRLRLPGAADRHRVRRARGTPSPGSSPRTGGGSTGWSTRAGASSS